VELRSSRIGRLIDRFVVTARRCHAAVYKA
jgi:hypothetical protein